MADTDGNGDGDGFPIPQWTEDVFSERSSITVIGKALGTALRVMVLDIEQANRIINLLYELDYFEYTDFGNRVPFHLAWHASGRWPKHISDPEEDKLRPARAGLIERHGGEDGSGLIPILEAKYRDYVVFMLEKGPEDAAWTQADLRKARQLTSEAPGIRACAASIQIALDLELDEIADELTREQILPLLLLPDSGSHHPGLWDGALESPGLWRLLADGQARKAAGISTKKVTEFVDKVVELLRKRLRGGPLRPFHDRSISELVRIFNDICVEKKQLGGKGATFHGKTNVADDDYRKMPETFLKDPATAKEIEELETKGKGTGNYPDGLPSEYKEFLLTSNGIYVGDAKDRLDNILAPTDEIELDDFAGEFKTELLPLDLLGYSMGVEIEWPEMPAEVLQLGSGGDEGSTWLICGDTIKKATQAFDAAWEEAGKDDRKRMERAIKDLYGTVEKLRELDHVIIRFYHWSAQLECLGNFHTFLEQNIAEIIGKDDNDDEEDEEVDDDAGGSGGEHDGEGQENDIDGDPANVNDENDEEAGNREKRLIKRVRPQSQGSISATPKKTPRNG